MLQGKTALVTGSTQGLGYTTVEWLASCACRITARTFRSRPRSRRSSSRHRAPSAAWTSWSTMPSSVTSRRSRTSSRRTGTVHSRSISPRHSTPRAWSAPARLRPHRRHRLDLRPARRGEPGRLRDDQDGADRLYPRRGTGDRCAEHHLQRHLQARASRPAASSRPSGSRVWSPSCAGRTAPTPQDRPFPSTAVGAQRSLFSKRGGDDQ